MSTTWYYADRAGQQQGPVDPVGLAAVLHRGEINGASLVWREGLADWVPLSRVASELGLQMPAQPPFLPKQGVVVIAPGGGGFSGALVAIVMVFVVVAVLGILAAIAIPAYQDYTVRAKMAEGLSAAKGLRLIISEIHASEQRCPFNGEDGIAAAEDFSSAQIKEIVVGTLSEEQSVCALQLLYKDIGVSGVDEPQVLMYLREDGSWAHESNVPDRYLPKAMRQP